ncbi:AAA family ATPase [Vibrio natriegens]|uniref:AAA family ATPase n=1 Tax=Vibrio natriegens TaxID=691 RepID=UPI00228405DA|nr:AAA family ATPase [Vibrio natriegens]ELA9308262.1 AAA family ATPase [Vibrio parahaemolyticus]MCY9875374.1 AAA family ATPase [Vibrio natriegens]
MKLVYMYVEHHNVLEDIGVSLSSGHKITFERKYLCLDTVNSNLDYYHGIQSSAIVGKNGTGKSTLLDFIDSSYEATDSSGFFIWFNEKETTYHICPINFDLDSIKIESMHTVKVNNNYRKFLNYHKVRLIKANNLSGGESSTISRRTRKNVFSHDLSLARYKTGSSTKLAERIARLINFFANSSWMANEQNIKVEFEFFVKPSSTTYLKNLLARDDVKKEWELSSKDLRILEHMLRSRPAFISDSIDDPHVPLFGELMRVNLLSILRHVTKYSGFRAKLQDFMFIKLLCGSMTRQVDLSDPDTVLDLILNSGMNEFPTSKAISEADAFIICKRFQDVVEAVRRIAEIISTYRMDIEVKDKDRFTSSQTALVIDLMMSISKLPSNVVPNFHYGWKGFSTGEFAKLNLFAELFYYINDEKRSSSESHLIVMDEVDLYLHPDWQREFLADTLNFLKAEYPQGSVQLILTSHSPIIIGDFLPEDIVSLYREPRRSPQVGESFGFGTQILELYMDGMHLSSTFGSHSKSHIDRILNNKINNCQTAFDKELVRKIKNSNIRRMLGDDE